jgi:hypothetical protein
MQRTTLTGDETAPVGRARPLSAPSGKGPGAKS